MKITTLNRKPNIIMAILYLGQCYLLYGLLNAVIVIAFTIYINQSIYEIACFLLPQLKHDLGLKCEVLHCFFFPH